MSPAAKELRAGEIDFLRKNPYSENNFPVCELCLVGDFDFLHFHCAWHCVGNFDVLLSHCVWACARKIGYLKKNISTGM